MSDLRKAGGLIIENISLFDHAYRLFEEVQKEIFFKIDEIIEEWAKEAGWISECDFFGQKDNTWLSSVEWKTKESDDFYAKFYLTVKDNNDEIESQWLTDLCGESATQLGLRFIVNHQIFMGKAKWNIFCKSLPNATENLKNMNFCYEGKGEWIIILRISSKDLASAYENEDYFEIKPNVFEVLNNIKKAKPIFDQLLEEGKKFCGVEC